MCGSVRGNLEPRKRGAGFGLTFVLVFSLEYTCLLLRDSLLNATLSYKFHHGLHVTHLTCCCKRLSENQHPCHDALNGENGGELKEETPKRPEGFWAEGFWVADLQLRLISHSLSYSNQGGAREGSFFHSRPWLVGWDSQLGSPPGTKQPESGKGIR